MTSLTKTSATRRALAVGALTALFIIGVGAELIRTQPSGWKSSATLVVTPVAEPGSVASASFYETLGQTVSTYAEILRVSDIEARTERALSVPEDQRGETSLSISVVPDTSILALSSSAPSGPLAEQFAATAAKTAASDLTALGQPFKAATLEPAQTQAEKNDGNTLAIGLATLAVALVAGLLVTRAVIQLQLLVSARQQQRSGDEADVPQSDVIRSAAADNAGTRWPRGGKQQTPDGDAAPAVDLGGSSAGH